MTPEEKQQFNRMLMALRTISEDYMTPEQMCEESEQEFGLEFEEAIEMAYENIQGTAKQAIKGIKYID